MLIPYLGEVIYKCETKAWDKAEGILKDIGFNDWDAFNKCKHYGLSSYKDLAPKEGK